MGQMLARADFAFDTSAAASLAHWREFEVALKTSDGEVRAQRCLLWHWRDGLLVDGSLPFVPWDGANWLLKLQEKVQDAGGFFSKQMFYKNAKMSSWEPCRPERCEEWRLCVVADNGSDMGLGGAPLLPKSAANAGGGAGAQLGTEPEGADGFDGADKAETAKPAKAEWHRLSTLKPWGMGEEEARAWRAEVAAELDGLTRAQQVRVGRPPMFPEPGSWPPSALEWLKHPPSTEA